jgi:hypothetical protein
MKGRAVQTPVPINAQPARRANFLQHSAHSRPQKRHLLRPVLWPLQRWLLRMSTP